DLPNGARLFRASQCGRCAGEQTAGLRACKPPASFIEADWDHVILCGIDGAEHRCGREQRDLVLAGAPAEEDADAQLPAARPNCGRTGLRAWAIAFFALLHCFANSFARVRHSRDTRCYLRCVPSTARPRTDLASAAEGMDQSTVALRRPSRRRNGSRLIQAAQAILFCNRAARLGAGFGFLVEGLCDRC